MSSAQTASVMTCVGRPAVGKRWCSASTSWCVVSRCRCSPAAGAPCRSASTASSPTGNGGDPTRGGRAEHGRCAATGCPAPRFTPQRLKIESTGRAGVRPPGTGIGTPKLATRPRPTLVLPGADHDHRNSCQLRHRGADRAQRHASKSTATVTGDHHQLSVIRFLEEPADGSHSSRRRTATSGWFSCQPASRSARTSSAWLSYCRQSVPRMGKILTSLPHMHCDKGQPLTRCARSESAVECGGSDRRACWAAACPSGWAVR